LLGLARQVARNAGQDRLALGARRTRTVSRSPRVLDRLRQVLEQPRISAAGLIQASGEDLMRSSRSSWLDWAMHSMASCAR
jgi:hypothetical protein